MISSLFLLKSWFFAEETAISLGKNSDLIKKAVEWSGTADHPGVQGEANRLLAWLIINSRFVFNLIFFIIH